MSVSGAIQDLPDPPEKEVTSVQTPQDTQNLISQLDISSNLELGLAGADNEHDAGGGYRGKSGGEQIDVQMAAIFRNQYNNLDKTKQIPNNNTNIGDILGTIIYNNINNHPYISPSNVEDITIQCFEDLVPFLEKRNPSAVASPSQIFNNQNSSQLAAGIRNNFDTFVISAETERVKALNAVNKQRLCDFILTFLFGNKDVPAHFSFDAKQGVVGKLFKNHPTARGVIFPQNIADSANTSVTRLGQQPNVYYFPKNELAGNPQAGVPTIDYKSKRNTFTKDKFAIGYIDSGFSEKSPFSFDNVIKDIPTGNFSISSYSEKVKQGPSLDYLLEMHLKAAQPNLNTNNPFFGNIAPANNCLTIGKDIDNVANLKNNIIQDIRGYTGSIFLDIKRMGDQDQVDACEFAKRDLKYVVLVTIDRLCALAARLQGIPCIYHYGDTMILYKNRLTDTSLTPQQILAFQAEKDGRYVQQYAPLYNFYASGNIGNMFNTLLQSIQTSTISIGIKETSGYPQSPFIELLKLKLTDISNFIIKIGTLLSNTRTSNKLPALDINNINQSKTNIDNLLAVFAGQGIDSNVLIELQKLLVSGTFNINGMYPFLNYDIENYQELYSAYVSQSAAANSSRPIRVPIDYYEIVESPTGYKYLLNTILNGWLDTNVRSNIKNTYDIDLSDAQVLSGAIDSYVNGQGVNLDAATNASNQMRTNLRAQWQKFQPQSSSQRRNGGGNGDVEMSGTGNNANANTTNNTSTMQIDDNQSTSNVVSSYNNWNTSGNTQNWPSNTPNFFGQSSNNANANSGGTSFNNGYTPPTTTSNMGNTISSSNTVIKPMDHRVMADTFIEICQQAGNFVNQLFSTRLHPMLKLKMLIKKYFKVKTRSNKNVLLEQIRTLLNDTNGFLNELKKYFINSKQPFINEGNYLNNRLQKDNLSQTQINNINNRISRIQYILNTIQNVMAIDNINLIIQNINDDLLDIIIEVINKNNINITFKQLVCWLLEKSNTTVVEQMLEEFRTLWFQTRVNNGDAIDNTIDMIRIFLFDINFINIGSQQRPNNIYHPVIDLLNRQTIPNKNNFMSNTLPCQVSQPSSQQNQTNYVAGSEEAVSIITLAFMNDLFNGYGNVSYFEYILGENMPKYLQQYLPYGDPEWNNLVNLIYNIGQSVTLDSNKLSTFNLFGGRRRRTYRHRRGKQNNRTRRNKHRSRKA